jgi:outer membrane receptor protein involved in Fe transport
VAEFQQEGIGPVSSITPRTLLQCAAAPAILGLAMLSAPLAAQTAPAEDDAGENVIIVTGSRIVQPNLESANPVGVVRGEELEASGNNSIGDLLNDLPQLRSTYSQQNSTRNLGNRGLNLLDLRGIGTQRTLVLVDGRRHVGSDILINMTSVDVNTIPTELVDRIDIVTGGASSVYGADAVAGVVNFVMKKNFEGLKLRGSAGISTYGDLGSQYLSAVYGKNFADGRGNFAVSASYSHVSRGNAANRPHLAQNDGFLVIDTDPAGAVNGSDGVFDRQYFKDIRSTTISLGGQLGFRYPNTATAPCGVDSAGSSFTCAFLFQNDGSVIPQTGTRVGLGPNGSFVGGNGYSGREGRLIELNPDLKRYVFNAMAHFEISPAFEPFVEAKYVRAEAFGSQSGPFFSQGTTLADGVSIVGIDDRSFAATAPTAAAPILARGSINREGFRLDNPYLSAQARTLITQQALASVNAGVNPNTGTAFLTTGRADLVAESQAKRQILLNQINDGSFRFSLRRNYVDLGIRDEQFKRETFRVVGGLRGVFNDDWRYELSFNYGQHTESNLIQGNVSRQRMLLAMDTVRNAQGQIVCRSQVDARFAGTDRAGNAAQLAADIAACVPLNPFGEGNISQAAKNYVLVNSASNGKMTQFVAQGFVQGDTSGFFNFPGGPVSFVVGGEYRRESGRYDLDDYTQAGYAFYNAIQTLSGPKPIYKDAFAEINLPLLRDVPLFHELNLRGSGRVTENNRYGTTYTYGGEGLWAPIPDIKLRGSYSRSERAPTIRELFAPIGQNFAAAPNDPCSARNLATGSANRVANCDAAGRPTGYDFAYTSSLEIRSGGNPGLEPEVADSFTLGVLLQPRFLPGFSLSIDWYDITVTKAISSIGSAQTILNLCYDSATLNNPFCALFQRAGASGGPRGEVPFRVLEGSLLNSTANFGRIKARGIDVQANYRRKFGFGTIDLEAIWTRQLKNESYTDPSDPNFVDVFVGELNDPRDQVNVDLSFKTGKVKLSYEARWIDGQFLNTFEDYNSVNGRPPQNTDYAPVEQYSAVLYHNVDAEIAVNKNFSFYGGIDNLTDTKPPLGLTGVGAGSGIYDNRGRYYYMGVRVNF